MNGRGLYVESFKSLRKPVVEIGMHMPSKSDPCSSMQIFKISDLATSYVMIFANKNVKGISCQPESGKMGV